MKRMKISEKLVAAANQNIRERDFWLNKLAGDLEKTGFPVDIKTKGAFKEEIASMSFTISEELFSQLKKVSKGNDHMLHMLLVTGMQLLLNKYTGRKDILMGTPIYKQDTDNQMINTILTIRNQLDGSMTFKELLLQVRQAIIEATEHYRYPIEILLEKLNMSFSEGEFPLFDVVLLLENIHNKEDIQHINTNIAIHFLRTDQTIEAVVKYNPAFYETTTIQRIFSHLELLLQKGLTDVNSKLSTLTILSPGENQQLLVDFNHTQFDYDKGKTIHQQLEEQVKQNPHKIAIQSREQQLSYGELNRRVNRIANLLRCKGVKPDTVVGVLIDRSPELIIAILGTLKAGGTYLPIDPQYPQMRILNMLSDSDTKILLTMESLTRGILFSRFQDLFPLKQEPVVTPAREQIKDLNGFIIPDRSLIDYQEFHKHIGQGMVRDSITFQATRGCPYHCAYCHKIWPRNHVVRSAEHLFEEIKSYYDIGIRRFVFVDDIFNLKAKNSSRFFELIIKHNMDVHFHNPNGLRGDIMTKEYIDLMVEAGTVNIALALESASPRLQKMIGKNLDIEKVAENLQYIIDKHPHVTLELQTMHGFPTETEEEAMMTLDFIRHFKWIDIPYIHLVKIYPNSDIAEWAIRVGISPAAINRASDSGYHIYSETIPFPKSFTSRYQTTLMNKYFLSKERLLAVLPRQMRILKEDELVQKYDSYLPTSIKSFPDLLELADITRKELGPVEFLSNDYGAVPDFNKKVQRYFPPRQPKPDALRILLLDLSMTFSHENLSIYDIADTPLGLMYVLTYLNQQYGNAVNGKIAKARINFDNFQEMRALIEDFQPDIIGVRTLSYFRNFMHKCLSLIRQWGIEAPIIAGGPYATSDYITILKDPNIDIVVRGEGEVTFSELIGKMLENSGKLPAPRVLENIPGIAFMSEENKRILKKNNREILLLDQLQDELETYAEENPVIVNKSSDMVYLVYTSGTAGKPKGVVLEHRNLDNLLRFQADKTNIDTAGTVLQFTTISFDVSFQEIFSTLLQGGKLCLISNKTRLDIDDLLSVIEKNRVNTLFLPPTYLKSLLSGSGRIREFPECVKHIVTAGEQLLVTPEIRTYLHRNKVYLHNHYGPAETHVVTTLTISPDEYTPELPSIGKPISNIRIYILDEEKHVQPTGMIGELYISGDNVGRGYCNNPDNTKQRFLLDPFHPGEKMYKTGDLARWLPSGEIEFLGRKDSQVKIRGFRIELGEIEKQLLKYKEIKDATVVDWVSKNKEKYLCAYIVSDRKQDVSDLKGFLAHELPDYMVPAYFLQLEKIPLGPNGKVNRRVLETLNLKLSTGEEYVPPKTKNEIAVARVWKEELKIDEVGIHDSFFDLGGTSFNIIQINNRVKDELGRAVNIVKMFEYPTICSFAKYLDQLDGEAGSTEAEIKQLEVAQQESLDIIDQTLQIIGGDPNV